MAKRQAILGRKIGMTQIFTETGEVVPVTVIEAGPRFGTQGQNLQNDGFKTRPLLTTYPCGKKKGGGMRG